MMMHNRSGAEVKEMMPETTVEWPGGSPKTEEPRIMLCFGEVALVHDRKGVGLGLVGCPRPGGSSKMVSLSVGERTLALDRTGEVGTQGVIPCRFCPWPGPFCLIILRLELVAGAAIGILIYQVVDLGGVDLELFLNLLYLGADIIIRFDIVVCKVVGQHSSN